MASNIPSALATPSVAPASAVPHAMANGMVATSLAGVGVAVVSLLVVARLLSGFFGLSAPKSPSRGL